ncbi:MAG: DUF4417 domain-containing protein [Muribaculaceae bacterium]|nr:DUF4417 domain-containing protein [Muribaculaceae bacterium]
MQRYSYGFYPQPVLPGFELDSKLKPQLIASTSNLSYQVSGATEDPFKLHMCECCNFTSNWQMPIIEPVIDLDILKYEIMGYDRIANPKHLAYGMHFYSADHKILPSLRSYLKVYERIKGQPFIIGPDYSIKMNMPFPKKLSNSFDIKLVTAWYQFMGSLTIPNIVWADVEHMDAYLEGYPKNSIIAINSTGLGWNQRARENWISGYRHVVQELNPLAIIRYGAKIKGEIESISVYKKNDNLKSSKYGW